jgi:hypothetical protein
MRSLENVEHALAMRYIYKLQAKLK